MVPLQALIGGLLVLSGLNPYVLIVHFLLSFPLVYFAAVLLHRVVGGGSPDALVAQAGCRCARGSVRRPGSRHPGDRDRTARR